MILADIDLARLAWAVGGLAVAGLGARLMYTDILRWRAARDLWRELHARGDPRTFARPEQGLFGRGPELSEPSLSYFLSSWTRFSGGVVLVLLGLVMFGTMVLGST